MLNSRWNDVRLPTQKLVLFAPERVEMVRLGRAVFQSRMELGEPSRTYLLRVFVDVDRRPVAVVTAYRTSKIEKYGGGEQ